VLLFAFGDRREHATASGDDAGSALVLSVTAVWAAYALLQTSRSKAMPLPCIATVAAAHAQRPALIATERISAPGDIGAASVALDSAAVSPIGARCECQYE
jgi:hypothetical protein